MSKAYLHIGTNQGDLKSNLTTAIRSLSQLGTTLSRSSVYETEAWGKQDQPNFWNMALLLDTNHTPYQLLEQIHTIEDQMGRVRGEKWSPRVIDIDILLYGKQIIKDDALTIPHKRMTERNFVLIPLMEIADDILHPVLNLSIEEIYLECHDICEVIMLEEKI